MDGMKIKSDIKVYSNKYNLNNQSEKARNVNNTNISSGEIKSSARIFCRLSAMAKLRLSGCPSAANTGPFSSV